MAGPAPPGLDCLSWLSLLLGLGAAAAGWRTGKALADLPAGPPDTAVLVGVFGVAGALLRFAVDTWFAHRPARARALAAGPRCWSTSPGA